MKIITNRGNKDYYDFYSGIMGIDEQIVYDRRKCTNSAEVMEHPLFSTKKLWGDRKREAFKRLWGLKGTVNYKKYRDSDVKPPYEEGAIFHFVLVVGNHYYFFEIERYLDDKDKVVLNYYLLKEGDRFGKLNEISTEPMFFVECDCMHKYWESDDTEMVLTGDKMRAWENPILGDRGVQKVIAPETVWRYLYEYISSLKDKPIVDTRSDIEHLESHGFDKKKSFRHRK